MDPKIKTIKNFLIKFIKNQVHKSGFKNVVVGLSGGVDSAVATLLAVEALGKENVFAVVMPYKTSSQQSLNDAQKIIEITGVPNTTIDITPMVDEFYRIDPQMNQVRLGNIMARVRMVILYDLSAEKGALVLGTSNKTELLLGYGTIFGDTACAINPLGDLYKTQIWELAKLLQIPQNIIDKKPTADLWEGQTDEGELGFLYQDVDKLLYEMIDNCHTNDELFKLGFDKDFVAKVRDRIRSNEFKRKMPVIAVIPKTS